MKIDKNVKDFLFYVFAAGYEEGYKEDTSLREAFVKWYQFVEREISKIKEYDWM